MRVKFSIIRSFNEQIATRLFANPIRQRNRLSRHVFPHSSQGWFPLELIRCSPFRILDLLLSKSHVSERLKTWRDGRAERGRAGLINPADRPQPQPHLHTNHRASSPKSRKLARWNLTRAFQLLLRFVLSPTEINFRPHLMGRFCSVIFLPFFFLSFFFSFHLSSG